MTSRVINLRRRRKQKARDEKRAAADDNTRQHGRDKTERELTKARNQLEASHLDGHRLDPPDNES